MANISYKNTADGVTTEYLKARGEGTDVNPFVPIRDVADDPVTFTETQLTAPGTTTSRDARGYQFLQFLLTVANINDSIDVRVEGSHNNSTWFPLGDDYIIRQNGQDMITFAYPQPLNYVRLNWVSEAGGTNATLDVITVIQ